MPKNRSTVVFVADDAMLLAAMVAAEEAVALLDPSVADVIIMTLPSDLSSRMQTWSRKCGSKVQIEMIDLDACLPANLPETLSPFRMSISRLALPRILADRYDRLLFLDADIRIYPGLDKIFQLDLAGHIFAASLDICETHLNSQGEALDLESPLHYQQARLTPGKAYLNGGVLLIDIAAWNKSVLWNKMIEFFSSEQEQFRWPNQNVLNYVMQGNFLPLSPAWNSIYDIESELRLKDIYTPIITHYAGLYKPWMVKQWHGEKSEILRYRKFYRKSPWRKFAAEVTPFWTRPFKREALLRTSGRRLERFIRRTLRGYKPPTSPSRREERFRVRRQLMENFLRTTTFADVQQGLTQLKLEKSDPTQN